MPTMDLTCQQCGTEFRARQRADKPRRFCSRACRDAAQTTRVTLTCRQCCQPFERKAYQRDWSQERGPFCGLTCYGLWQRENIQGPLAPTWGMERNPSDRASNRWYRNRAAALERDGHCCVECGATSPLHVHHVVPWEAGQADPHAQGNLVTLCVRHHKQMHARMARALGES